MNKYLEKIASKADSRSAISRGAQAQGRGLVEGV